MGTIERTTTIQSSATTDDGSYYNGSYYGAQIWYWVGRRLTGSTGAWSTYLFPVPADVDPDAITSVTLKMYGNSTGTAAATIRVRQGAGVAPASSGADRPDTIYNTVGSTGEVDWGFTISKVGDSATSPDISSRVVSALNSIDQSTEKLSIHLGPDTAASGTANVQMFSRDYTTDTAKRPTLTIVETLPDNPTPSVSAVAATSTVPAPLLYERKLDISYDSTPSGYSDSRVVDIYLPMGAAPANGWPVAFFVHGGGFMAGDEDDVSDASGYRFRHDTMAYSGCAIVSVSYKLTEVVLDVVTGWTRPHPQQDMFAALKWIGTQSTYDLDSAKIIGCAYSAGGHLLLEAACFLEDPNIDTYEASSSGMSPGATPGTTGPLGDRYTDYPTLDITQGRTDIPRPIGVFTFGGPVSLSKIWDDSLILDFIPDAYFGHRPSTGYVKAAVNEEGDIDAFITGLAGSIYDSTTTARVPAAPKFPIGVTYTTNDTTVPVSAGYTPLQSALNTVGYNVAGAATDKQVNVGVALSRYSYTGTGDSAGGHDTLMMQYNRSFFVEWLKNTLALTIPDVVTATATVPTPAWSEEAGATGGTAEPTAVAATASVPTASAIGAGLVSPSAVAAVAAVPAVKNDSGWVLAAVVSTTAIATQTAVGGGTVTPTAVAAVTVTPSAKWGAGWVLSSAVSVAAIAAQAGVGGGFTTPAVVTASAAVPAPARGAGWTLSAVVASTGVAQPTWAAGVAATAVGAQAAIPAPSWSAGWLLSAVTATTAISAQAGVGNGLTTPPVTSGTVSIGAPTWGATWIISGATAQSFVPAADVAGGMSIYPSSVTATAAVPSPTHGAGWAVAVVASTTTIPAASWLSGQAVAAAAVTASVSVGAVTTGSGNALVAVSAVTAVGAPSISGAATTAATVVAVVTAITAPAISGGGVGVVSVVTGTTTIPSQTSVADTVMPVDAVAAISYVMAPTIEYGSVIAVMTVAALVSIGSVSPSSLAYFLASYSDGASVVDGAVTYFDGASEIPSRMDYAGELP